MVATVKEETAKYWSWREELNLQPVVYKNQSIQISLSGRGLMNKANAMSKTTNNALACDIELRPV